MFVAPSTRSLILLLAIVTTLLVTGLSFTEVKEEEEKIVPVVEVESDDESEGSGEYSEKETPAYNEPPGDNYGPPPPPSYAEPGPHSAPASYPEPMKYPKPPPSYAEPGPYSAPASYPEPMKYPKPPSSYPEPASYPEPMKYPKPPSSYPEPASYPEPMKYPVPPPPPPSYPEPSSYPGPPPSYPEPGKYSAPASYPEPGKYMGPPPSYPEPSPYSGPPPSYPEPGKYMGPPPSYPEPASYPGPPPSYPEPGKYMGPPPSYPEPPPYSGPPPSYPEPGKYMGPPPSYPEPASYSGPPPSYPEPAKYLAPASYPEPAKYSAPASYAEPAARSNYSAPTASYSASYPAAPAKSGHYSGARESSYAKPGSPDVKYPVASNYTAPQVTKATGGYQNSYPLVMLQYPQHLVATGYKQQQQPYSNYTAHMPSMYNGRDDSPWGDDKLPESWWIYQVPVESGGDAAGHYKLPLMRDHQRQYRANNWSLSYYATAPYRQCPREVYKRPPTPGDFQAAFAHAQAKLAQQSQTSVHYLNASQPSYAARHQVFSSLATGANARADEQGLLVEFASEYLAERACLTKWDKQRYLPTLTLGMSTSMYPAGHSCQAYGGQKHSTEGWNLLQAVQSKYRTLDGFANNPHHPYWGKSNVCHIRFLSPDYADGVSEPRTSYVPHAPLPNPRHASNVIHNDVHLEGPYNMLKMQWGQFINHDITNTQLSSYEGLVDCCRTPGVRGCYPIAVPPGDPFYLKYNVTCLNFVRSAVCPLCQLGPRQQINKNSAFLDASQVYGTEATLARQLRLFRGGLLRHQVAPNGEHHLPLASHANSGQCQENCHVAGDSRVNQHPALTALHVLLMRRHNQHALGLAQVHPQWPDEFLFQEARRLLIAEYQMVTYNEYLPIVFGPVLSEYFRLAPSRTGYTLYNPEVDATTWNEYSTAACRFGHSQIQNLFGLYPRLLAHHEQRHEQHYNATSYRLKDWFMNPSLLLAGHTRALVHGLMSKSSLAVDPWVAGDVRNYLYKSRHEHTGGDLAATNIQRGRDHGLPSYTHYLEYCFNHKVNTWQDLSLYIPWDILERLKALYVLPENVDLFTGGISERHFPEADIGPTFACINGIQYYHLKFGDRYYFEHRGQAGSFSPEQLYEIKKSTMARLLCRTAQLGASPAYAFFYPSQFNPLVDCANFGEINYRVF